jgi:hypothetical protein
MTIFVSPSSPAIVAAEQAIRVANPNSDFSGDFVEMSLVVMFIIGTAVVLRRWGII